MSRLPRLLLAVVVCLVVAGSPGTAYAHATLVKSNPTQDQSMAKLPAAASITFNENVGTPAYLIVVAPNGKHAETGKARIVNHTVTHRLRDLGIAGRYRMSYRVVSADGHPVERTITFDVTQGRTVEATQKAEPESFVHRHASHIGWAVGGVVLAGLLLFWPRRRCHE